MKRSFNATQDALGSATCQAEECPRMSGRLDFQPEGALLQGAHRRLPTVVLEKIPYMIQFPPEILG